MVSSLALKTDAFDYHLPGRLIAQHPAERRDASRLLVVDRQARTISHRLFSDLPGYLRSGDCLFRNNAAVIPARLHASRPSGGQVECLLLRPAGTVQSPAAAKTDEWWCLLRPGKKLPISASFGIAGIFTGTVQEKTADGLVRVSFESDTADILAVANRIGEMPLPPYIERDLRHKSEADRQSAEIQRCFDRERYQTVYANRARQVAAAAPTAGLHFTPELLRNLAAGGVQTADLTLHVGLGTFRPITTEQIEDHVIHREIYEISRSSQNALFATSGRRVAIGTTSVRTIEDFLGKHSSPLGHDCVNEAGIFIYPPRNFAGVDALVTNFHQPRSTLLCLVSAFLSPGSGDGIAWLKEIYAEAIARDYRFFSFGDAMLIL
ncbi:MAG TPA: tRNA preQ1(34) S-adenosylmethionine ribosyltransferase-isomerase QueA [Lacunisphaera sp.]|jgi:S-adenosylmethionine:tRNA ribosyltransferase-isomerase